MSVGDEQQARPARRETAPSAQCLYQHSACVRCAVVVDPMSSRAAAPRVVLCRGSASPSAAPCDLTVMHWRAARPGRAGGRARGGGHGRPRRQGRPRRRRPGRRRAAQPARVRPGRGGRAARRAGQDVCARPRPRDEPCAPAPLSADTRASAAQGLRPVRCDNVLGAGQSVCLQCVVHSGCIICAGLLPIPSRAGPCTGRLLATPLPAFAPLRRPCPAVLTQPRVAQASLCLAWLTALRAPATSARHDTPGGPPGSPRARPRARSGGPAHHADDQEHPEQVYAEDAAADDGRAVPRRLRLLLPAHRLQEQVQRRLRVHQPGALRVWPRPGLRPRSAGCARGAGGRASLALCVGRSARALRKLAMEYP